MCPPTNAPNVTAGFTWPPEILAPTDTATNSANACDIDAEIRPAGVVDPPSVSLPTKEKTQIFIYYEYIPFATFLRFVGTSFRGHTIKKKWTRKWYNELTESHASALASKNKNEHRDKLCKSSFQGIGWSGVIRSSYCNIGNWHFWHLLIQIFFFVVKRSGNKSFICSLLLCFACTLTWLSDSYIYTGILYIVLGRKYPVSTRWPV